MARPSKRVTMLDVEKGMNALKSRIAILEKALEMALNYLYNHPAEQCLPVCKFDIYYWIDKATRLNGLFDEWKPNQGDVVYIDDVVNIGKRFPANFRGFTGADNNMVVVIYNMQQCAFPVYRMHRLESGE